MPTFRYSRNLPSALGPYRLMGCLGQGGFAPVWRAEEVHEGKKLRDVAVKLFFLPDGIEPSSAVAARWLDNVIDEARALCRVEHRNVVRFHALHREDNLGIVGLVMEYIGGQNLGAVLRAHGPLPEQKVLDVGISVAWALAAVHDAGLVHRDIKPENLIEAASGYKLIDFGIVTDAPREPGSGGLPPPPLIGTPGYVAPEYIERRAPPSPAGDIYALGATLLTLATGRVPQLSATTAPGADDGTQRPPAGPASLFELVKLLLDPEPDTRPRHADWVARELERLRDRLVAPAPPAAAPALSARSADLEETDTAAFLQLAGAARPAVGARGDHGRVEQAARGPADNVAHGDTVFEPNARPPLVGRDDLLSSLERAAREVRQGNTRLVLLTGPLGVGRTRLLEAAIGQSGFARERTLRVHGSPERQSPLRPLLLGLRAVQGGGAFRLLERALERAVSPAVLPATGQADEALEAVEDALFLAATEEPVLLAVDDAQWVDERTLKLLHLLLEQADRGAAAKLLVLVAARDEPYAPASLRAFLGAVQRKARPGARHLAVCPLTPAQAAAVAQGVCPLDRDVEHAVVRGSGGVPFFLVNALLAWREIGAIVWLGDTFVAAGEQILPAHVPGVAALVEARLGSYFAPRSPLWRAALRVLAAVALHGGGLPMEILTRACGEDASIEEALETLMDAGILVAPDGVHEYGFAQEMVRQAVLNLVRQKPWFYRHHRALLDAVATSKGSSADAAFLALGYEKLGAREEACVWLGRAMENALRSGLFAEAARFGDRLAVLAPGAAARSEAALATVRALVRGRQLEEAKERLERVDSRAHDVRWRIVRLEVARARYEVAEDPELLADADALADATLSCEARMALAGVAPRDAAVDLAGEAVALAERLGPALEFPARVLRAELLYAAELRDPQLAERDLRRALAIAHATSSIWQQVHIEADLAVLEAELGRPSSAIGWLRRLAEQAESMGMRGQLRTVLNNLSAFLMREGSFAEAAQVALRTAVLAAEAGDPTLRAAALSLRADALLFTGELDAAMESADESERLQGERDDGSRALTLLRRADILEAMGKPDEALADARAAQEVASLHGDEAFFLTAVLWEKLHQARRGEVPAELLREALAAARVAGVGQRPVRRRLIDNAAAWLAGTTAPLV